MQSTNAVFNTEQRQDAKAYLTIIGNLVPGVEQKDLESLETANDWTDEYCRLLEALEAYVEEYGATQSLRRFITETIMTYVAVGLKPEPGEEMAAQFLPTLVKTGYVSNRFWVSDADVNLDNSTWYVDANEVLVSRVKDVVGDVFVGELEPRIMNWLVREIDDHAMLHHGLVLTDMIPEEFEYWWNKEYVPYLYNLINSLKQAKVALAPYAS